MPWLKRSFEKSKAVAFAEREQIHRGYEMSVPNRFNFIAEKPSAPVFKYFIESLSIPYLRSAATAAIES